MIFLFTRILWYLVVEVCKTVVVVNPEFIRTYFLKNRISYDLRNDDKVLLPPTRSARYGINSLGKIQLLMT